MVTLDCRTCGACCAGELDHPGFADVSVDDLRRMSRHVRSRLVVERRWMDEDQYATPLVWSEKFGGVCGFLRGTPGVRCSCAIYESRPEACRRFTPGSRRCLNARRELMGDVATESGG